MSKNEILTELYNDPVIDDIIFTITSGHKLKDDLKGELFLILSEMTDIRIINAWKGHYLIYMCVNILKKQYHSSSSPFHKKWRKDKGDDFVEVEEASDIESDDFSLENEDMLIKIRWIVENKLSFVDKLIFACSAASLNCCFKFLAS